MKTVPELLKTVKSIPEAEREQEITKWCMEAKATLSAQEIDELCSELERGRVLALVLEKRMRAKGAKPDQKAREVLAAQDWLDAELASLQQEQHSFHSKN